MSRIEAPPKVRSRTATAGSLALVEPGEGSPGEGRNLSGTFSVFNQWQEINNLREGHFFELIKRGAFAKSIRESLHRVRVL